LTTLVVFLPFAAAIVLLAMPSRRPSAVRWAGVAVAAVELLLVLAMWVGFDTGGGVQFEQRAEWIPSLGVGYHVGVDGLSLPLVALSAGLFLACMIFSLDQTDRVREYVALFLFLETACVGVFAALDLVLFFVFYDLSIVGMYFIIALWGHEGAERAALKFFLYTFLGSLSLLLGVVGLYVSSQPRTFDMLELTAQMPLAGEAGAGALVLLAIFVGFAIKTPVFPFHTWLPPAHVGAPAAGSAILAGVLLKMGTYGFVRIAMPILPEQWRRYALAIAVLGVVSVVYGALVALAQPSFKRLVAYTSVNHMGYILLGIGAAGLVAGSDAEARQLAVSGAITQMVSHGLITGALFLLTGVLYQRAGTYDFARFGGLAKVTPVYAAVTAVAAFASLGLPGFAGFIAEFQVFLGSLGAAPVPTAIAFLGVLITAALFLWALQRLFLGPSSGEWQQMADLRPHELAACAPLLILATAIGVFPRFLLDVIEPAARSIVELVAR
jgi:NADH-quinone oxidoreductase subunit M